jgi:hypothetical protein
VTLDFFFGCGGTQGDYGAVLDGSAVFGGFHGPNAVVLVVVLILPETTIPIDIILFSGLSFINLKGVLQNILVLVLHEAAISSVLNGDKISGVG